MPPSAAARHRVRDGGRDGMPALRLGPLLRYVDDRSATIWVETDRPCRVEVLGHGADTWSVHGHHFALVAVGPLEPGTATEYTVALDGELVWPQPGTPFPPSVIRTLTSTRPFRLAFGSCRRAAPMDARNLRRFGADALVALAERLAASPGDHGVWPDLLFLGGDQVYADEPSDSLRERLARRHDPPPGDGRTTVVNDPDGEVHEETQSFEEYTWLYHESWMEPSVRWLFSTVPTMMMLDDHDLRDDWNTSLRWRRWATAQPWWRQRVVGAFASYWVYQHLGNLSPAALADDPLYGALGAEPDDRRRTAMLDEFALRADAEPSAARWSVSRDLQGAGATIRIVLLDVRCSRVLEGDHREIIDQAEWQWFADLARPERPLDHLLVGSTLPILLPPGVHEVEGWNEAVAAGVWGELPARLAEAMRQAVDMEHWAAYRSSLMRLCRLLSEVAHGDAPPASVLMLSGDVHASYIARARLEGVDTVGTSIVQLTMSPFRNRLNLPIRLANRLLARRDVHSLLRRLRRGAEVEDLPLTWDVDEGIWFDNGLMTIVLAGRSAAVEVDHAALVAGRQVLQRTYSGSLTAVADAARPARARGTVPT